MRLGHVALNGVTYYTDRDINAVRTFLRDAGLECYCTGWASPTGNRLGAIYFESGRWTGAHWQRG